MKRILIATTALAMLWGCSQKKEETTLSGLRKSSFVSTVEEQPTALFVLSNGKGGEACLTNYGGRLVSLVVPDRNGKPVDVVLGYDNIADYVRSDGNFGGLIGRYGNRIANGEFSLDGVTYRLNRNDNGNCLHGGARGYHTRMWKPRRIDAQTLELSYFSPDGEAGFPGNLDIRVVYRLDDAHALHITYQATTDKPTVVNLTNHSYFNLSGVPGSTIADQTIRIDADRYTPVDSLLIPTGEMAPVEGTPLDLRVPVAIGARIDEPFDQLQKGRGYDLNWILNTQGDIGRPAARAYSAVSGIYLEVYTDEPGIQFYTGNFMDGNDRGKHGVVYPHRGAFCLETQHYPDSPNRAGFPSVVLRPGETYRSRCIYRFGVEK